MFPITRLENGLRLNQTNEKENKMKLKPTNGRLLVSVTKEVYEKFTTDAEANIFEGVVEAVSDGNFGDNPIPVSQGENTNFSWVRKPPTSGVEAGNRIYFTRDALTTPVNLGSEEDAIFLILLEEHNIFAIIGE